MSYCRSQAFGAARAAMAAAMIAASGLSAHSAAAQSPGDFYKGKQVIFIIPVAAGGDYDLWGRMIIRHLARHVPGKPSMLPQNMPGGGQ